MVAQQGFHAGQRQVHARGRIGIRKDDGAARPPVVLRTDAHGLVERDRAVIDAVQLAIHGIEAVADVGEQQRRVMLEQGHEGQRQHFVGTVADKHLLAAQAVVGGQGLLQFAGRGVRVEAQAVVGGFAQDGQHLRRRAVGVFVGVEFDQVGQLGLLTGDVGGQLADDGAPESAHCLGSRDGGSGRLP